MPSKTLPAPKDSDRHKKWITMLDQRLKLAERAQTHKHAAWRRAEDRILTYVPETEADGARREARENDGQQSYTTMQLPYSFALLMAAHTYWTSVFFARDPVHQFAGLHGEAENQVQAVESLMAYQVEQGDMLGPYYIWLYDAGKYGAGILGHYWADEFVHVSDLVEGEEGSEPVIETRSIRSYSGNRVYNVSPYDFYPDPRVTAGNFQKGEFCAVRRRVSWSQIKARERQGYYTNIERLTPSHAVQERPQDEASSQLERPEHFVMDETGEKRPAVVDLYEVYVEIIPSEWGIANINLPQKWVFTLTRDKTLVIGAQPFSALSGRFPFDVMEPEVEAYGSWNRGIPEMIEPIQNTMDWLLNSHFYNVRAVLNNLFLADPTKIVMKDLRSTQAGGVIRLKPEAYGSDIRSFFQQVPMADVTQSHVNDLTTMLQIGERMTGINDQILGVLAGGGRKTATEIRTSTGFGVNRLKTTTEYMSATSFAPHARSLLQNSQQYYDGEMKLRIVGDMANQAGPMFMDVTPELIAGNYGLVPVDGTLPVDRFAQATLWKDMFATIQRMPQIMQQYDLGKIFAWVGSLAGLKNINQFKIQVVPDDQLQRQADAGNIVPMPQRGQPQTGAIPPIQENRNAGVV
jgi:hypothetical protein